MLPNTISTHFLSHVLELSQVTIILSCHHSSIFKKLSVKQQDVIYVSFDTGFGHMPAVGLVLLVISGTLHEDRQVSTLIKLEPNEGMANREINQIISDTDKGHEEIKL